MQRLLQVVLSAWREAERVAAERPEASEEHAAALLAAGRLRDLYGELVESAQDNDDDAPLGRLTPEPESAFDQYGVGPARSVTTRRGPAGC